MSEHEKYMRRCFDLAIKGIGFVSPNPMVGSVIVHNGKIIGEGFHEKYGHHHAEVNAINSVKDKNLLKESTIYVNLEPCAHFGKTPPCSDLIIQSQIPKVVIGCIDSFSEVAGKGIEKMKKAGIQVTHGILENDSRFLNRRFFTFHEKKRPYIILKWAESKDGFIDRDRSNNQKGIHWITTEETKSLVHKWRHEESGILVGKTTIAVDNPSLTVRKIKGTSPTRVVIDKDLRLDYSAFNVGDHSVKSIILTKKNVVSSENLIFENPVSFNLADILESLHKHDLQSIIIEGGKKTLNNFIENALWDEARILIGENKMNEGSIAPRIKMKPKEKYKFGKDQVKIMFND